MSLVCVTAPTKKIYCLIVQRPRPPNTPRQALLGTRSRSVPLRWAWKAQSLSILWILFRFRNHKTFKYASNTLVLQMRPPPRPNRVYFSFDSATGRITNLCDFGENWIFYDYKASVNFSAHLKPPIYYNFTIFQAAMKKVADLERNK